MEQAVLVTVDWGREAGWTAKDLSMELRELVESSGAGVLGEIICRRDTPTAAYLVGKGKAFEIAGKARETGADAVIFNEDLSFVQQRNLEEIIDKKVIDRSQLILDIFSRRARSNEGKLQVELAQLLYLFPRLGGKGILLSRLGGGIGTRGPGEKKLETDRRRIRKRITKLQRELEDLKKRRQTMRKSRIAQSISSVALVGYTNAGKSTLLNALTDAGAYADDKLFATLDPLTRRCILPNNQKALFIDTVGFLHRLPHHLIESFKATLEEVTQADVLLHVLDVSHPKAMEQSDAVHKVLCELGADNKPVITALNKIDKAEEPAINRFLRTVRNGVPISALKRVGIDELLAKVMAELSGSVVYVALTIPHERMRLLTVIYEEGQVLKKEEKADGVHIEANVPVQVSRMLQREGLS